MSFYDLCHESEMEMYHDLIEEFNKANEEGYDDYTPSSTNGDYSPSNPWDAPGMSIHDFI